MKKFLFLLLAAVQIACSCSRVATPRDPEFIPPSKPTMPQASTQKSPATKKTVPLSQICIVLDPGHGGKDTGTKTKAPKGSPQVLEKTLALRASKSVEQFLQSWGYNVLMTRTTDVFIPLQERVAFAEKHHCNLFVSIHFNSAPNKKAQGIEVYYYKKASKNRIMKSQTLGKNILARLKMLKRPQIRGCFPANFCVIRETTMPAVLVEGGFLSNSEEAKNLKNPHYIRLLSWSIAKGIDDFIKKNL